MNIQTLDGAIPLTEKELVGICMGEKSAVETSLASAYGIWNASWDLYNLQMDFSKKADWQSQQVLPDIFSDTEQAATQLISALQGPGTWFSVELQDQELETVLEGWLGYHLENIFYSQQFEDACKFGLLSAMLINKVFSGGNAAPLRIKTVSPFDFWFDLSGKGAFEIERTIVTKADLKGWAQNTDAEGRPLYFNLDRIKDEAGSDTRDPRWAQRAQLGALGTNLRKGEVELLTRWGNIYHPQSGDLLKENAVFSVANRTLLVRGPDPNPFAHKKSPYIYQPIIRVPGSPLGKSLMQSTLGLAGLKTEVLNLFVDAHSFAGNPSAEVDTSPGGANPKQIAEGLYPGKLWGRRMPGPYPIIRPLKTGQVDPSTPIIYGLIDREKQRTSSITDPMRGMTQSRRGLTATQHELDVTGSQKLFDRCASHIEANFMAPTLDLGLRVLIENATEVKDYWLERELAKIPGAYEKLAGMSHADRLKLLEQQMKVKVHGISSQIRKGQNLMRLEKLMLILSKAPELAVQVDLRALLEKYCDALQLDSSDILKKKEQVAAEIQARQQAMAAQAAQGAGRVPPGMAPQGGGM